MAPSGASHVTQAALSPFAATDLAAWLSDLASRRGAHPMLIWAPPEGPGARWSYAQFADAVARLAGGLARRGIRPGDRVMVHLENCPEALLARFACAWLGAVCVGTNAMAAGPELAQFAAATGAVAAITQPCFLPLLSAHCRGLRFVAVTQDDAGVPPATPPEAGESLAALLAEAPQPRRAPDPAAPASIMFTTGTTGLPKGVVWTHANMLWGARVNALQQGLRADDVSLVFLPLYHVVGLSWCVMSSFWAGATVVLQRRFSARGFWPSALAHGATIGSHVFFTLGALAAQEVPPHRFRRWIYARHEPQIESRYGIELVSGWGMTEVLTQAIVCEPGGNPPEGAIGRPSIGYRIRIVAEDGSPVPPGGSGHLLVGGERGLSLFAGYDGNAAAEREAFDAQGDFRTGDRVKLREDGWIAFEDRIKDVLKVGGEGVSPAEIERVLMALPDIAACAVVGRPDATYGELPVAFVVARDGAGADLPGRAIAHCAAALAKFKVPREVILLADLPRVGFGKIARTTLRDMAARSGEPLA